MMQDFIYRAVDVHGETVDGVMAAESEQQLDARLQELGYWLIDVSESASRTTVRQAAVPRRELIDFFNGLHAMLSAGIPVTGAISAIADETEHNGFAAVLRDIQIQVEAGSSMDAAMTRHPEVFNQQIVNLIKAGDFSGNLAASCQDISHHLEWVDRIMADIRQASLYPMMVLLAVLGLVFLMFAFVVPRFSKVFASLDLELPLLTQVVVDIGDFTSRNGWMIVLIAVLLVAAFKYIPSRVPALAHVLDHLSLSMPVFGGLNRMIIQSRFCHNLSLLLKAGVPVLQALELCKGLLGNRIMQRAVEDTEQAVNDGRKMSEALRRHDIISPVVLRMVIVGEETGQLDDALACVSARFDKEVPRQIKRVFGILEPMIMICLIVIVGLIGGAVFLPMFSLMSGIGG